MVHRFLSALELASWLQPTFASSPDKGFRLQHNREDGRVLALRIPGPSARAIVLSSNRGILALAPHNSALIAWSDYEREGVATIAAAIRAFFDASPGLPAPDPTLTLLHGLLALGGADPEHAWDLAFPPAATASVSLPGWQVWRDLQPVISITPEGFLHYPDGTMSGFEKWGASLGSTWRLVLRVAMTIDRYLVAETA